MKSLGRFLLGGCLLAASVSAGPAAAPAPTTSPTDPTTAKGVPANCTNVWSTTETTITSLQWSDPTLITIILSKTITTLVQNEPAPTSYPWTFTDTFISSVMYEEHMTYADGHSRTTVYPAYPVTIPITRVQTAAPTAALTCATGSS